MTINDEDLHKNGKPYVNEITRRNGSFVKFMFHEQPISVFESEQYDVIIFDEPPLRKIWIAMMRGQREINTTPEIWMLGTPLTQSWLRTEVYDSWVAGDLPDVECFFGTTEANKANLREGYIEDFSKFLTEKEKRMRLQGQFFDLDDLPLNSMFKDKIHVISQQTFRDIFDKDRYPCVVAIDPHSSKPHHACLIGVNGDDEYFYIKEIARKEVAREFARTLRDWMSGYRVIDIIMDSAGTAESTGGEGYRSFYDILREEGVLVRPTSFDDKSDEDFIDRIRSVLAIPNEPDNFGFYNPKLRIVEGNDGIIRDVKNVTWQKYRDIDEVKPKLDIRTKDFLACLKYGLASGLHARKDKVRPHRPTKQLYGFGKRKYR
jgi:hypothetical protein